MILLCIVEYQFELNLAVSTKGGLDDVVFLNINFFHYIIELHEIVGIIN